MPTLDQLLFLAERNSWQDLALCAGNVFFCFTLVPMLRHPARPPLLTCIPTGIAFLAGGFVFASLHLWLTALTQAITGIRLFWHSKNAVSSLIKARRRAGRSGARLHCESDELMFPEGAVLHRRIAP